MKNNVSFDDLTLDQYMTGEAIILGDLSDEIEQSGRLYLTKQIGWLESKLGFKVAKELQRSFD